MENLNSKTTLTKMTCHSDMKLIPKNWTSFQHYKNRNPPWIKLHKTLLDDRKFMCLPVDSRALAPLLWLLASENQDGVFDADIDGLSFRLRMTKKEVEKGLNPLIKHKFFLDASTMLAPRLQDATPETEREREKSIPQNEFAEHVYFSKKKRKLSGKRLDSFLKFWHDFDYRKDKASAADSWLDIPQLTDSLVEEICRSARKEASERQQKIDKGLTPIYAQGWLSARRWEDQDNTQKKPKYQEIDIEQYR